MITGQIRFHHEPSTIPIHQNIIPFDRGDPTEDQETLRVMLCEAYRNGLRVGAKVQRVDNPHMFGEITTINYTSHFAYNKLHGRHYPIKVLWQDYVTPNGTKVTGFDHVYRPEDLKLIEGVKDASENVGSGC